MLLALLSVALATPMADLARTAVKGESLSEQGEAIVALAALRRPGASAALTRIAADTTVDPLVRTWAAAARIQRIESLSELTAVSPLVIEFPALARPVTLLLDRFPDTPLPIAAGVPLLSQEELTAPVGQRLLEQPAEDLVTAMLTVPDDTARRALAGLLATRSDTGTIQAALVAALVYDGQDTVPWDGGALFLPSIQWSRQPAEQLIGHLIAWHLHCERNKQPDLQRQIANNLNSNVLFHAVKRRYSVASTEELLRVWGAMAGQEALEELLAEQGATKTYEGLLGD